MILYASGSATAIEASGGLFTLANGTTYYGQIGGGAQRIDSVHIKWDNAIIVTITVEDTNFDDVNIYSATAGEWIQENPSTAYVAASGGTATAASVAVAGGTAGGCIFHVGNWGTRRARVKLVVAGTGGAVKIVENGKA